MRKLRLVRVFGRVSVLGSCALGAAAACGDFAALDAPAGDDARDAGTREDFDLDGPDPYGGAGGHSASSGGAPIRPLRPQAGASGSTGKEEAGASSGGEAGDASFAGHSNGGGAVSTAPGGTSGIAGAGASGRGGTSGAGASGRGGTSGAGASGRGGTNGTGGAGTAGRGGTGAAGSGTSGSGGAASPTGTVFFSEYVEGTTRSRKALEIVAAPARALDGCVVEVYFNGGNEPTVSVALSGTASATQPFVVCYTPLVAENPGACDASGNLNYNGNDAILLRCAGRVEDSIGRLGEAPNLSWGSGAVRTHDMTLRRACSAWRADVEPTDVFEPSRDWTAAGTDAIDGLGVAECQATPAAG